MLAEIGRVLGKIPSGLFIVTTQLGIETSGFLASWVQQVSFKPPLISMAVESERPSFRQMVHQKKYCVHILGSDQKDYMKIFSGKVKDPFAIIETKPSEFGPVLTNALGLLQCRLREVVPAGDHQLVIGEIVAGVYGPTEEAPYIHVRSSGFNY